MKRTVIISKPYEDSATNKNTTGNSYRNLRIHSLPGLHEHVSIMLKKWLPDGATILELGSGSGAMCARLSNMHYQLTGTDYVSSNFKLHGEVSFYKVDLNSPFSLDIEGEFDCVLGMEIIEHLENPREFLRNAMELCKKNGLIVLTTPNISSPASKALFCRFGTFQWFDDSDYENQGHIRPIAPWELNRIFDELSLEKHFIGSFGNPYRVFRKWPRMNLFSRFISMISDTSGTLSGEILIMAGRKR